MKKILVFVGVVSLLVFWSRSPPDAFDLNTAGETVADVASTMIDAVTGFLTELF